MTCRRDSARLGAVTDPLGHTTTRTYDAVSRLVTQTDPLGRLTWYTYDSMNRLATRTGRVSAPRAVKVLGCVPQAQKRPRCIRHAAVVVSAFHLGSLGGNVTLASSWRGRAGG